MKTGLKRVMATLVVALMLVSMMPATGLAASTSLNYKCADTTTDQIFINYDNSMGTVTRTSGGDGDNRLESGETWAFTATPLAGYTFGGWTTSGDSYVSSLSKSTATLSFSYKTSGQRLGNDSSKQFQATANFTAITYTITTSATHGTITGSQTVNQGSNCTISYSADTGYHLSSVTVDSGANIAGSNPSSYTFSNVTANHSIAAVYAGNAYTVKYDNNGGSGSMDDSSFTYGVSGNLRSNTFTKSGCLFMGWATSSGGSVAYADGASVSNLNSTDGGTTTLYAVWATMYTITTSAVNGTITATKDVASGTNCTISYSANTGYHLSSVTVDGSSVSTTTYASSYTFSNVTTPHTIAVVYDANTYTVSYNKNSTSATGTMANSTFTYDVPATLSANAFLRTGYTFMGWATTSGGGVAYADQASVSNLTSTNGATVTLYAVWSASYTVTYNINGGSGSVPVDNNHYATGNTVTVQNPLGTGLSRSGYRFVGWNTGSTYSESTEYGIGKTSYTMGSSNVTFYAEWESTTTKYTHIDVRVNGSITIDYQINGVSQPGYPKTISITTSNASGSYVVGGVSHTISSFTYSNTDGGEYRYAPSSSDYFLWPDSVTINATLTDTGGNTYSFSHTYTGNEMYYAHITCPTDQGYDFILNGSEISDQITHDVTFKTTAGGTINGGTSDFNATDVPDGTNMADITPSVAALPGYTFSGWSPSLPGTVTSDETYTAHFAKDPSKWFTVTYNGNGSTGGTVPTDSNEYMSGDTVTVKSGTPTQTGYIFAGWSDGSHTYNASDTFAMPSSNVTLTAQWTANKHDIIYYVDGSEYHRDSNVAFGSSISPIAAPTKTGYTFSGWSTMPPTMPDTDVQVYGSFTANKHDIIYYVDGAEYHRDSNVAYGTSISAIAAPTKTGYTFSGWSTIPPTMPDMDVQVYGTFTANKHDIIYYVDGALYHTDSNVAYGTSISLIAEPTQAGYTFSGWSAIPGAMPDSNVIVNGTFAVNHHDIIYYVDGVEYHRDSNIAYGASISPIAAPTMTGYTFSGWSAMPTAMPDSNVIVNGTFAVNHHDIIYYVDGIEYHRDLSVAYGTSISPIAAPTQAGYTFSGWSAIPGTMPDSNVIVNGTFAVNHHDIIYYVDGAEYHRDSSVAFGSSIIPIAAPTQTGYTFSGWSPIPGTMPDSDVIVNGTFAVNHHDIIYFVDGTVYHTDSNVAFGTSIIPIAEPTQTGYTFSGWGPMPTAMPDSTVEVFGTFAVNHHDIIYMVDGVEYHRDSNVAYGASISPIAEPTQAGYTFSGWSAMPGTMPDSNVIVSGSFNANLHNIIYYVDGSEFSRTENVAYGTDLSGYLIPEPGQTGYTFSGWSALPGTMPDADVQVYGTFAANTHDIIYYVDGALYQRDSDIAYGTTISPIAEPSETGYTFSGWSSMPGTMPDADVEVYGTFSVNNHDIIFMVDGTEYSRTGSVDFGTDLSGYMIAEPTQTGYTFSGWSTMPDTMPDSDVTITGTFAINHYDVIYIVDGTEYHRDSDIAYGSSISAIAEPTQTGYTFSGWSAMPGTMPDSDVTVTGSFAVNHHDIIFMVDGVEYSRTGNVAYGTDLSGYMISDPAQTGYTFSGWSTMPDTMPDSDVTITGTFAVNHHDVIYYVDGVEYHRDSNIAYGTSISAIADPTKTGYTFSGWSAMPGTMPDSDVTVTGTFAVNHHDIIYYVDGALYSRTDDMAFGASISPIADPTKTGYTFSGWSSMPDTMPDSDVEVYGTFAVNHHDIIFMVDGTEYSRTEDVAYGTGLSGYLIAEPTQTGYTFSGWSPLPGNMPDSDVTVTGSFAVNHHDIVYYVDGVEYHRDSSIAYGTSISPIAEPTQTGYTFSGWSAMPGTMPDSDVTVSGTFAVNHHDIVYYVDGVLYYKDSYVAYGTSISPIPEPTQTGYTFSGWSAIPDTMPDSNVAVSGTFAVNHHDIIYMVDGVEYHRDSNIAYGASISAIAQPTQAGHTFSGWSTMPDKMPDSDVIVSGSFEVNLHNIIYYVDGAEYSRTENVGYGTDLSGYLIAEPTKTGYTFSGWSPLPGTMPDSDVTVTGSFAVNHHDIIYMVDGVEYHRDSTIAYGASISLIAEPTQTGYTFSGWSPLPGTMPDSDVTVTGSFAVNHHDIIYMVDGALYSRFNNVAYGTSISPIAAPTQTGYTFSGWSPMPDTMPDSDVTVTGSFAVNHHDVIYYVDGVEYHRDSNIAYGTSISLIAQPTQTGYTFSGWSAMPGTMPDSDVTVTGTFAVNHHDIIYMVDGVEFSRVNNVAYGTGISPIAAPTQTGYTFSGWSPMPGTMPDSDVTVSGSFAVNHHDVIYYVDGVEYHRDSNIAYGTGISLIAQPTQTGYTFSGWSPLPGTMPDSNVIVNGTFAINTYRVRFFEVDGTTQIGMAQTVNWDTAATLETAPDRLGFTFAGWVLNGDNPDVTTSLTNVKENIDAVASYNRIVLRVTFENHDGTVLGTDHVPYGGSATPPDEPSWEGHTFTGWDLDYSNVTENLTVVAGFEINTYTVKFVDYDGTVIATRTVNWNTDATAPTDPSRDGFTFTGWDTPFTNVKSDLTVTAQYNPVTEPTPNPSPTITVTPEPPPQTGGGDNGWLWWLLVIPAGLLILLIFIGRFAVVPIAETVTDNGNGTYTVQWGYENRKTKKYKVDDDKSVLSVLMGKLIKSSAAPPVEFEKGRVENVFTSIVDKDAQVQWKIKGRKAKVDINKLNNK